MNAKPGRHPQDWRWDDGKHLRPTNATIIVAEPTEEVLAERKRKINEGAVIVPFGFARALGPIRQTPPAIDRMNELEPPPAAPTECSSGYCGWSPEGDAHTCPTRAGSHEPPDVEPLLWEGDQA